MHGLLKRGIRPRRSVGGLLKLCQGYFLPPRIFLLLRDTVWWIFFFLPSPFLRGNSSSGLPIWDNILSLPLPFSVPFPFQLAIHERAGAFRS